MLKMYIFGPWIGHHLIVAADGWVDKVLPGQSLIWFTVALDISNMISNVILLAKQHHLNWPYPLMSHGSWRVMVEIGQRTGRILATRTLLYNMITKQWGLTASGKKPACRQRLASISRAGTSERPLYWFAKTQILYSLFLLKAFSKNLGYDLLMPKHQPITAKLSAKSFQLKAFYH